VAENRPLVGEKPGEEGDEDSEGKKND
jgi:hypothetical protein